MDETKLPWDIANVKFLENGEWYMVAIGTEKLYVKVPKDQAEGFINGGLVQAYHVMTANLQKPLYLSVLTATIEPWLLNGKMCSLVAKVHPVQEQVLDGEIKRSIAGEHLPPKILVPDKKLVRLD